MYSLFCIDIFLMKKAAADAATFDIQLPGQWAGYFSEDRPLGWDPVAAGNRAGDGMARLVSEEKATDTLVCGKAFESKTGGVLHEDHVFGREP